MKLKNLITLTNCIVTICIIGCLIQIKYILTRYFTYDFTTLTKIDIPEKTILPDLVISVETINFINHTKLIDKFPQFASQFEPYQVKGLNFSSIKGRESIKLQLRNVTYQNQLTSLLSNLTLNQTTSLLFQPRELIELIFFRPLTHEHPNDYSGDFDYTNRCLLQSFYKLTNFYIVISCNFSPDSPLYGSSIVNDLYPGPMDFFALLFNFRILITLESFGVALIRRNSLPNGPLIKWTNFRLENSANVYLIHFYESRITKLSYPYSNCIDYRNQGYFNRDAKWEFCLNNQSKYKLGQPFYSCLLPSFLDTPFVGLTVPVQLKSNKTLKSIVNSILHFCKQETSQQDCFTHIYSVRSLYSVKSLRMVTALIVDITRFPDTSIEYRPRLNPIECLVSIGGILGFWFGFAVNVHLPEMVTNLWTQIINKTIRKTLNQNNQKTKVKKPKFVNNRITPRRYN